MCVCFVCGFLIEKIWYALYESGELMKWGLYCIFMRKNNVLNIKKYILRRSTSYVLCTFSTVLEVFKYLKQFSFFNTKKSSYSYTFLKSRIFLLIWGEFVTNNLLVLLFIVTLWKRERKEILNAKRIFIKRACEVAELGISKILWSARLEVLKQKR